MKQIEKYVNWWIITVKLYLLYGLLIYLVLNPFIKQISVVTNYLPDDKYCIPMIAACFYLMVQIFMGMFKGEDKDVVLLKFEDKEEDLNN